MDFEGGGGYPHTRDMLGNAWGGGARCPERHFFKQTLEPPPSLRFCVLLISVVKFCVVAGHKCGMTDGPHDRTGGASDETGGAYDRSGAASDMTNCTYYMTGFDRIVGASDSICDAYDMNGASYETTGGVHVRSCCAHDKTGGA